MTCNLSFIHVVFTMASRGQNNTIQGKKLKKKLSCVSKMMQSTADTSIASINVF